MLTDDEIAGMRSVVGESFVDLITNYRPEPGSDVEGNPTQAWTQVGVPFYGWLRGPRLTGADAVVSGGEAAQDVTVPLLVAVGTDMRPGDRPVIRGARWRVLTVADVLTHLRCYVEKVDR